MKLDIGCGKNKKEGFHGVDQYAMEGVDTVLDLNTPVWPWEDNSVEEVHCSHFLEHLTQDERCHFMNELYRIMAPGAKALIITPSWASTRAYGDPTHKWPAVSEMFYFYLSQEWRDSQAPHSDIKWNPKGYSCNFNATWGHSFGPELGVRNQDYVQMALNSFINAAQDIHATIVKPLAP